jgi:hypothetical protein
MKRVALSALAALALAGAPASGQTVMLNFSFPEMREQVAAIKATPGKEGEIEDKTHYLQAKAESGLNFTVYGIECDSNEATQRCRGAEIVSSFDLASEEKVAEAMEQIDYAAVGDFDGGEGRLRLSRYLIFDEGITPGNLKANLKVFISIADDVWDMLDEEGFFKK